MSNGKPTDDRDDYSAIECVSDLRSVLAEASFSEDYELERADLETLNLLLNQYLVAIDGSDDSRQPLHKLQQRLESSARNFIEACDEIRRTPEGGRWLLDVCVSREEGGNDEDARLTGAVDPVEMMRELVARIASHPGQHAPGRTGPKEDAAFEVLVRRLFRFWQQVRQRGSESPAGTTGSEETYDLVRRTLVVIGKEREIKSLRNLVPADPSSRYWLPKQLK